jgi:hypothetical protein
LMYNNDWLKKGNEICGNSLWSLLFLQLFNNIFMVFDPVAALCRIADELSNYLRSESKLSVLLVWTVCVFLRFSDVIL